MPVARRYWGQSGKNIRVGEYNERIKHPETVTRRTGREGLTEFEIGAAGEVYKVGRGSGFSSASLSSFIRISYQQLSLFTHLLTQHTSQCVSRSLCLLSLLLRLRLPCPAVARALARRATLAPSSAATRSNRSVEGLSDVQTTAKGHTI